MARPLRIEFEGAFYHVTSRGDEKKDIYKSVSDRERFLEYLHSAKERYGAVIHGFCLMSSHYHLMVGTPRGNLSQVMRHINGAYTTYYNVKRQRAGHLFQGRYKAILVEADEYALELSRYMHLNPVRAGMIDRPENYCWSSYSSYIGKTHPPPWLTRELVLGFFGKSSLTSQKQYQHFVEDLIGKEYTSPLSKVVASTILGRPKFVEQIMEDYLEDETNRPDVPAVRGLNRRFRIEGIIYHTTEMFPDPIIARRVAIHLAHEYSGATLKEIGSHFELAESGVSKVSARLKKQLEAESQLREKVARVLTLLHQGNVQT